MNPGLAFVAGFVVGVLIGGVLVYAFYRVPQPPDDDGPRTYQVTTADGSHEYRFTISGITNDQMWKFANLVVGGQSLDYRTVCKVTGISRDRYAQMRKVLKDRFPRCFDDQNQFRPDPLLREFFMNVRKECRTEQHRTQRMSQ